MDAYKSNLIAVLPLSFYYVGVTQRFPSITLGSIGAVAIAFVLVALFVYGPSLANDFVRWDDGLLIFENPIARGFSLRNIRYAFTTFDPELYIPLTLLSYQLDYAIAGTNPAFYHVHNLLLHTINALLVFWLFMQMGMKRWWAAFGGLIFLVHPLHTEAVVWASARKDLLSTLFLLVSLASYLHFRKQNNPKWYAVSIAACLLGLLAKVTIAVLPIFLLLLDFWEHRELRWSMLKDKIPYFLLSGFFVTIALFGKTAVTSNITIEGLTFTATKAVVFYLQKLVWPTQLSVLYPYTNELTLASSEFLFPAAILLVLTAAALFSIRYTRSIAFGAGFFLVATIPSFLNYVKGMQDYYIGSDRYAYIGSIGIIFLFLLLLQWVGKRQIVQRYSAGAFVVIAMVLTCTFGFLTTKQARVWQDTESLFNNVLEFYPNAYAAHTNIGNALRRRNELDSAVEHFNAAIAIRRHYLALSNLASIKRQLGEMEEAITLYGEAIMSKPEGEEAHVGLGVVYAQQGKLDKAEASYRTAIRLEPRYAEAHLNLGALFAAQKKYEQAIASYDEALNFNPFLPQAHYNRGVALRVLGRNREARDSYERAVELSPAFVAARINLGIIYAERKEMDAAVEQFEEVLKYDPDNRRAISVLKQLGLR